jgi:hypothetical protein
VGLDGVFRSTALRGPESRFVGVNVVAVGMFVEGDTVEGGIVERNTHVVGDRTVAVGIREWMAGSNFLVVDPEDTEGTLLNNRGMEVDSFGRLSWVECWILDVLHDGEVSLLN